MIGEYNLLRRQLKGYMFEIVILHLISNNGFHLINHSKDNKTRENREGFIELRGRGAWHQIDCPCDYSKIMPFIYPIRLLGEVKFFSSHISKNHIREFIGIIKDIQENYFVENDLNVNMLTLRRMEIGAFFSANGFNDEAEKLAYAHGVKTISYQNNYVIDKVKNLIDELEKNYISVRHIGRNNLNHFKRNFKNLIIDDEPDNLYLNLSWVDGYLNVINQIRQTLYNIKSSFIGTTSTGVFLHFVSERDFPNDVFQETDEGQCEIYYENHDSAKRYFYLTINGDKRKSKFYFTPPSSLNEAAMFGKETALNEKARIFKIINVNIDINNINRNLILRLNSDWLDNARLSL